MASDKCSGQEPPASAEYVLNRGGTGWRSRWREITISHLPAQDSHPVRVREKILARAGARKDSRTSVYFNKDPRAATNMPELIPNRFLFKFEFPLYRCARAPKIDGRAERWAPKFLIPPLHELDGEGGFGAVYAAWNADGLYIACQVEGKSRPPRCDPATYWKSDNLRLMTDMRDTRNIRRATKFCQQFYFLPTGGKPEQRGPVAGSALVHRATQDAPIVKPGVIPIAAQAGKTGYSLTAHLPARVLHGFDPAENPRIGFYYMLEDAELGRQSLTVGDELNWWIDPSTWPTATLM
ncbi:MAG: hypothetical protein ABII12_16330, partial [Planctomycetota bacterium]